MVIPLVTLTGRLLEKRLELALMPFLLVFSFSPVLLPPTLFPRFANHVPNETKQSQEESDAEEERPDEVKNQERNANQLSAVEENINIVSKTIKKRSRDAFKARIAEISQLPEEEQSAARKRAERREDKCVPFNTCLIPLPLHKLWKMSFIIPFSSRVELVAFVSKTANPKWRPFPIRKSRKITSLPNKPLCHSQ